jgi:hypothetical protein
MHSTASKLPVVATGVRFELEHMIVEYDDGRAVTVPLEWFPRLRKATPEERAHWRLIAGGIGFHWPDIDEDIDALALLRSS